MSGLSNKMGRATNELTLTIADGETDSNLVDVRVYAGYEVAVPSGFSTGDLTVLSGDSESDTSPVAPKDAVGDALTITSAAAGEKRLLPDGAWVIHYIGLRAGSPVSGDKVFTLRVTG